MKLEDLIKGEGKTPKINKEYNDSIFMKPISIALLGTLAAGLMTWGIYSGMEYIVRKYPGNASKNSAYSIKKSTYTNDDDINPFNLTSPISPFNPLD